jgi:hypothetical protein
MTEVMALHRSSKMLWTPSDGDVLPVHRAADLEWHLSAWRDYGTVAQIHSQAQTGREASITALGIDGWLVKLRAHATVRDSWPRSAILARLLEDGSLPSLLGDSPWYAPDPSTDLAGAVLIAEEIQFDPVCVARALWAWLSNGPMPPGFTVGRTTHDLILVGSVAEALALVNHAGPQPWPADAAQATVDLAEELDVDRIVLTSPGQIVLRVPGAPRRVRVQFRGRGDNARVRAVGLTDALGHEYSMDLPGRQNIRISRRRSR